MTEKLKISGEKKRVSSNLVILSLLLAFLVTVLVGMWWIMPIIFLGFMTVAVVAGLLHVYLNRKTVNVFLFTNTKKYVDDEVFDRDHERMFH